MEQPKRDDRNAFAELADETPKSLIQEVWYLLTSDRRWWLAPIIIALVIIGGLIMLTTTGAAPFIYTLF